MDGLQAETHCADRTALLVVARVQILPVSATPVYPEDGTRLQAVETPCSRAAGARLGSGHETNQPLLAAHIGPSPGNGAGKDREGEAMKAESQHTVQLLEEQHSGYEDWQTYAVRDQHNVCVCVVGAVDHATASTNHETALRIARALEHNCSNVFCTIREDDYPDFSQPLRAAR